MKTHNITGCTDCPFNDVEFDDFAVGADFTYRCSLAEWKGYDNNLILMYDTKKQEDKDPKTPEWCPLKQEGEQGFKIVD